MPAGRPTEYTQQLGEKICERIATSELGLEQVLAEIELTDGYAPGLTSVWRWKQANEEFRKQYLRAREDQAELLHDRAQQIAQNALIGHVTRTVVTGEGENAKTETTTTISDNVERSKLIVHTTLKRAGQLDSKRYGEKIQQEVTGKDGGPLQFVTRSILDKASE